MATTIRNDAGVTSYPGDLDAHVIQQAVKDGLRILTDDHYDSALARERDYAREQHKKTVRQGLIEYFRDIEGDTDTLAGVLEHFGYEPLVTKFRVRVLVEGTDVLSVIVEADDEDEARNMVEEGFTQDTTEVDVDFDYNGDGDIEDATSYTYDFGNLYDFLSFDFEVEEV